MPKAKDIAGNRYGKLTAIEYVYNNTYHERVWRCRCDCGNESYVSIHSLVSGNTRSCGCLAKYIRQNKKKPDNNFKCDYCGKDIHVIPYRMKTSKHHFCSRTCQGDYYREHPEENANYKERDEATRFFARKILRVRASARRRGIPFSESITVSTFVDLWEKQSGRCYYSNIPLSFDKNDKICLVSVDRVNNSKGYEPDNIVLCVSSINSFKFTYPKEELMRLISLIRQNGK